MINQGYKVLDATIEEIRSQFDPRTIIVEPLDGELDEGRLYALPGVEHVERTAGVHELSFTDGTDPAGAIRAIAEALPVRRVELRRPTLEDVFVELATREGAGEASEQELRESLRAEAEVTHA
jgi:ABC-type uncharacterized transport system ATPase subunit